MEMQLIVAAVLCIIFWCINKQTAYIIGVALILSALTIHGIGIVFGAGIAASSLEALTPLTAAVNIVVITALVFLSLRFLRANRLDDKRALITTLVILLAAIVIMAIALGLYHSGNIEQNKIAGSFKAAGAAIGFALGMYFERLFIGFEVKSTNIIGQIVKAAVGIIGVVALQEVLLWNFEPGLFSDMVRHAFLMIWITVVYTYAIKRFFTKNPE